MDFRPEMRDFGSDFKVFWPDSTDFLTYFRYFRPDFRYFRSDFKDYWNFREYRDFRPDFSDFRPDFRTSVHQISDVLCPSIKLFVAENSNS